MGSLGDARASTHFVDRREVQLAGFCMGRFLGGLRISMVALTNACRGSNSSCYILNMCICAGACGVVALLRSWYPWNDLREAGHAALLAPALHFYCGRLDPQWCFSVGLWWAVVCERCDFDGACLVPRVTHCAVTHCGHCNPRGLRCSSAGPTSYGRREAVTRTH